MKFKPGDRVHVTKLDGEKVDFYATLTSFGSYGEKAELVNCTNRKLEGLSVHLPNEMDFGPDRLDYYTLATYYEIVEELAEETEEHVETILGDYLNKLGLEEEYKTLEHENETLKNENKALRLQADEYFELWQNELQNKENE